MNSFFVDTNIGPFQDSTEPIKLFGSLESKMGRRGKITVLERFGTKQDIKKLSRRDIEDYNSFLEKKGAKKLVYKLTKGAIANENPNPKNFAILIFNNIARKFEAKGKSLENIGFIYKDAINEYKSKSKNINDEQKVLLFEKIYENKLKPFGLDVNASVHLYSLKAGKGVGSIVYPNEFMDSLLSIDDVTQLSKLKRYTKYDFSGLLKFSNAFTFKSGDVLFKINKKEIERLRKIKEEMNLKAQKKTIDKIIETLDPYKEHIVIALGLITLFLIAIGAPFSIIAYVIDIRNKYKKK